MRNLTDSQKSAITCTSRDILTIAGAGAGKTTVLTERIDFLMNSVGVPASQFCVLTFTRKAAGELKHRLASKIELANPGKGQKIIGSFTCGTFHSIALRILRTEGHVLGYAPGLGVIDEDDSELLIEEVAQDFGLLVVDKRGKQSWKKDLSGKKVKAALEQYYTRGLSTIENDIFKPLKDDGPHIPSILLEYHQRLFQMNVVDFGSILIQTQRVFMTSPDVLERYRAAWKYVFVDELQDANTVQHYGFLDFFKDSHFFGVGDRRQSIYGFRGSRPDLMTERHPNTAIVDLRECFRCGDEIVEAANKLISVNADKIAQPMIGATGRLGAVRTICGRSEAIAAHLKTINEDGFAWNEIAVIARSHRVLKRIGQVCADAKVPFHRVGSSFDICDAPEFKKVFAAMRLNVDKRDNMAFRRLVQAFGLDSQQYAEVRPEAAKAGCSHWVAMLKLYGANNLSAASSAINNRSEDDDAVEFADEVWAHVAPESVPFGGKVTQFWAKFCQGMSVTEACEWYITTGQRRGNDDTSRGNLVTLLTGHAAKGLEWPCVIIANCNEGDFPSAQAGEEGVEEERRLFYVAMTRAKDRLICHYRLPEDQAEGRKLNPPSRFLKEAGILS